MLTEGQIISVDGIRWALGQQLRLKVDGFVQFFFGFAGPACSRQQAPQGIAQTGWILPRGSEKAVAGGAERFPTLAASRQPGMGCIHKNFVFAQIFSEHASVSSPHTREEDESRATMLQSGI